MTSYILKNALLNNFRFLLRNSDGHIIGSCNTQEGAEYMRQRFYKDTKDCIMIEEVDVEGELSRRVGTHCTI